MDPKRIEKVKLKNWHSPKRLLTSSIRVQKKSLKCQPKKLRAPCMYWCLMQIKRNAQISHSFQICLKISRNWLGNVHSTVWNPNQRPERKNAYKKDKGPESCHFLES